MNVAIAAAVYSASLISLRAFWKAWNGISCWSVSKSQSWNVCPGYLSANEVVGPFVAEVGEGEERAEFGEELDVRFKVLLCGRFLPPVGAVTMSSLDMLTLL